MIPKINLLNNALNIKHLKDLKKANNSLENMNDKFAEINRHNTEVLQQLHEKFDELRTQLSEILSKTRYDAEIKRKQLSALNTIWNLEIE